MKQSVTITDKLTSVQINCTDKLTSVIFVYRLFVCMFVP